ncbi:peptidylprolyl isomerase [Rhodobacteraceae bacterium]|nr:peptidylprolyl isomerase [Paracoccaceae bacterium]
MTAMTATAQRPIASKLRSKAGRIAASGLIAISFLNSVHVVPAFAQASSQFAPQIIVNGMGITGYEISQRTRMMELLGGAQSDPRQAATDALINERLQVWQAKNMGMKIDDAAIKKGMEEFASRANLTADRFIQELGAQGVEEQTFRDFVKAGLLWREVVRAKFGGRIAISDVQIDRALSPASQRGQGTRVLLSEIIIPAPPGREGEAQAAAQRAASTRGQGAFSALARQVSASRSRENGGQIDWMPLENLPPPLRKVVLGLAPGEASQPIGLQNAIAVFMLRAIDENGPTQSPDQTLDYAVLTLGAPGSEQAATLRAKVETDADRCDDLYTVARGLPADRLTRESAPLGAVPQDVGIALSHLDAGETDLIQRGPNTALVMLCARTITRKAEDGTVQEPDRSAVENSLENQQIQLQADGYLADLRDAAVIVRP